MRRSSPLDCLLVQTWRQTNSSLRDRIKEECSPTLLSTWVVIALLEAGLSRREPEVRDCLAQLNNWIQQLDVDIEVLDESSTGLLGLYLYIHRQGRKGGDDRLGSLFLHSVEHNLKKSKALSLGTNVDLLMAVSAGLASDSGTAQLRAETSGRLRVLSQNASALELVQLLQSWELIERVDDIPRLDVQHRLESIAADENSLAIEKAMAYYGQLRMAELFGISKIEYEMHFLNYLGLVAASGQDKNSSLAQVYALSLPYLKRRMSYDSLFDAWQKYFDSTLKRSKTENYLSRWLFALCVIGLATIIFWPWFRQLDIGFQVSIGSAVSTVVLMLTTLTFEMTFELYGRQFWQRGRVEIAIGLMGASIALIAALIEVWLK